MAKNENGQNEQIFDRKFWFLRSFMDFSSWKYTQTTLKSPEYDFLDPQNCQNWPLRTAKMSKFLTENFDFQGHLWTFEAENTLKSGPFQTENNA